jgi:phospho-N-acetylmuramoyl-pentapeptide-transferase
MVFWIVIFLQDILGIKVPTAFTYSSTRMILAAITTLLMTIFLGPFCIKKLYALKIGQPIRDASECPLLAELHSKKKETPTMGGVLILASMLLALFLWMDLTSSFTWILMSTTLVLGFLGGWDDYLKLKYKNSKGLKGRWKIRVQFFFASAIALYLLCPTLTSFVQKTVHLSPPIAKMQMVQESSQKSKEPLVQNLSTNQYMTRLYLPFVKDPIATFGGITTLFCFFLFVFVIMGSSNAVNLTDGLDGLAAGLLMMVATVLGIVGFLSNHFGMAHYLNILYIEGSAEIAVYLMALTGACLGFLWYNGYPAQIFMGDTGSLALGGIVGVSAILLRREFLLALVGGIFVAEALSVILQVLSFRYRNKKRIFLCAPLHHHFEYKGWAETKVVLRFWIIGLLLAFIGMASLKIQ